MSEINIERAYEVYEAFCKGMTEMDWKYERDEDDLVIRTGIRGEDLPMDIIVKVSPKAQVVSVLSPMPFKISEEKRIEAAVAVCVANHGMINGCFDYDISDGGILLRLATSYIKSEINLDLIKYVLMTTACTVDNYNDRFFALSKGLLTIEQFIEKENG